MTRTVRPRTNVHFYPSTFRFESRMLKETATALASGAVDDVLILARWEPGLAEREDVDADRRVRRLRTPIGDRLAGPIGSVVRLLEWQVRAFVAIVRARPVLLNPHSLPVLPVAMAAKVVTRAEVIYDTHELETETVGSSALRRRIGRLLEWSFVRFCTAVVVVNESIGEWYRAHHPSARVVVVRNVPYRTSHPVERTDAFRSLLSIPDADLVFLYQGSIHRGRAAEMLLDVFVDMPTDRHMVFMGYGDLEPTIRAASTQRSNIHFVAAVPPGEVLAMTASADVGICLIENVCVSYHLSLPNKLMEYTSAGIPTIASAFPEMSRFITDTGAGWTVEVEPGAVAALIRSLDADAIAAAAERAREARSRLSWEDESVPLVDLYRSIGSRLGR